MLILRSKSYIFLVLSIYKHVWWFEFLFTWTWLLDKNGKSSFSVDIRKSCLKVYQSTCSKATCPSWELLSWFLNASKDGKKLSHRWQRNLNHRLTMTQGIIWKALVRGNFVIPTLFERLPVGFSGMWIIVLLGVILFGAKFTLVRRQILTVRMCCPFVIVKIRANWKFLIPFMTSKPFR